MPNLPPRGWGYRAVPPKPKPAGQKKDLPKPPKPSKGGPTTSKK